MQPHIKVIGFLLTALAFVHILFPKRFNWKEELQSLSLLNKQMMEVHTFFIAFTVFLMGILCLTSADELINTSFGRTISLGFFLFWFTRLIFQLFVYSPQLWRGKKFETTIHILFTCFWLYCSFVFLMVYIG
jgi:hypothetical protein